MAQKKDIGGTIRQIVPSIGIQYIPTNAEIADVATAEAVESARLKNEEKIIRARQALMPDDNVASDFFEKATGNAGEVNALQKRYATQRQEFYNKANEDPDYVFTPEGKQEVRNLYNVVSFDKINELKNNKESLDIERKKVSEKGTGNDIYYNDGVVLVETGDDGETIQMSGSDYYKQVSDKTSPIYGKSALTINENANRLANRVSNTKGEIPAMGAQNSYVDAIKELTSYFDNAGTSEREQIRNQFTQFGLSSEGEPFPAIATIAGKGSGNARQLQVVFDNMKYRLSTASRNSIAAELLRRGVNPERTGEFVKVTSAAEMGKRTSSSVSDKVTFDIVGEAIGGSGGGNESISGLLGYTPAAEVNDTLSGTADASWYNPASWFNKNVDARVVERNGTIPIDKTLQKSVSGGSMYQIGGDGDSISKDGRMVNVPVMTNVIQDNPVTMWMFTGGEFDPKTNKPKTDDKSKGKIVLTGGKGTVAHDNVASLNAAVKKDGMGNEYVYDKDTETNRYITRRGFRIFKQVDDDGLPTGTQYFKPVTLDESALFFPGADRSGQKANMKFYFNGEPNAQGRALIKFTEQQMQLAAASGDNEKWQAFAREYGRFGAADKKIRSNDPSQKARGFQEMDAALSDMYYNAATITQMRNTPGIKPSVSVKPIDTQSNYR